MAFTFDAGRVSLDLLATLSNRTVERLVDPGALAAWLSGAGLISEGRRATPDDLDGVRGLRAAVVAVVDAEMTGGRPRAADIQVINAAASVPARAPRLELDGGRLRRVEVQPTMDEVVGSIARDAIALLTGRQRELLRECAAVDCSGIYLDLSPSGNRRWCSAARCGNRARVAAHRARRPVQGSR